MNHRAFEYYVPLLNVKTHIEKNYSEPISLETAAEIACMEKKYFSKFFHKKVGMRFTHWLTSLTVVEAMRRLRSADHSIIDTAYAVGFQDLRTFQRAFKKYTNLSPREFKHSVRPEQIAGESPKAKPAELSTKSAVN